MSGSVWFLIFIGVGTIAYCIWYGRSIYLYNAQISAGRRQLEQTAEQQQLSRKQLEISDELQRRSAMLLEPQEALMTRAETLMHLLEVRLKD